MKASTITGKSVTLPWEYGANVETNHQLAAFDLARKMEWPGQWVGVADEGGGYAFMHVDAISRFNVEL